MNTTRVFINGFGRIGRAALRIMIEDDSIEIAGINDVYDFAQMGKLLYHDTLYHTLPYTVRVENSIMYIAEHAIPLYNEASPDDLKLEDIDVLLQCTGIFLDRQSNESYLHNGVKKVLISAPASCEIPTYVMQVNHESYQGEAIISNSSCSANAIIPIATIIEEISSIKNLSMSMFHSYTAYQSLLDVKHYSKDIRRSRSATQNIQPLMSSAAAETEKFFPHLKNKLYAKSIRVPVSSTTLYDLTFALQDKTTIDTVNKLFIEKSYNGFKEMVTTAHDFSVSTDFTGSKYGAIIDTALTQIIDGDLLKVMAWQDNEYGYATQLVRMVKHIS